MKKTCLDCGRELESGKYRHYCPECIRRRTNATAYEPDALEILKARIEVHRQRGQAEIATALEQQLDEETLPRRPGSGGARPAT